MNLSPLRLSELAPFKGIPTAELATFSQVLHGRRVARGEVLYTEGEAAHDAALVLSGRLAVWVGEGERRRNVGDLWPGDLIGDAALFDVSARRSATVIAMVDTDVAVLDPSLFTLLPTNRALVSLERHLLTQMARRIRAANTRLEQTWRPAAAPSAAEPPPESLRSTLFRILGIT